MPLRTKIGLAIGVVMFALGAYLSVNLTVTRQPRTGSLVGDLAFMTFFLVKALLYFRNARRRPQPPDPSTRRDGD